MKEGGRPTHEGPSWSRAYSSLPGASVHLAPRRQLISDEPPENSTLPASLSMLGELGELVPITIQMPSCRAEKWAPREECFSDIFASHRFSHFYIHKASMLPAGCTTVSMKRTAVGHRTASLTSGTIASKSKWCPFKFQPSGWAWGGFHPHLSTMETSAAQGPPQLSLAPSPLWAGIRASPATPGPLASCPKTGPVLPEPPLCQALCRRSPNETPLHAPLCEQPGLTQKNMQRVCVTALARKTTPQGRVIDGVCRWGI